MYVYPYPCIHCCQTHIRTLANIDAVSFIPIRFDDANTQNWSQFSDDIYISIALRCDQPKYVWTAKPAKRRRKKKKCTTTTAAAAAIQWQSLLLLFLYQSKGHIHTIYGAILKSPCMYKMNETMTHPLSLTLLLVLITQRTNQLQTNWIQYYYIFFFIARSVRASQQYTQILINKFCWK